jgi:capsular exopolysaccharide synthesis family protein
MHRQLLSLLVLSYLLSSCTPRVKALYFPAVPDSMQFQLVTTPEQPVKRADLLSIAVSSANPEATELFNLPNSSEVQYNAQTGEMQKPAGYLVGEDGNIRLPLLGPLRAEGLTKRQLQESIRTALAKRKLLVDPIVDIRHLNFKVTVLAEVTRPTVITVTNEKITLLEALGLAGDLTIYGKRDNVLVIRDEAGKRVAQRINLNSKELFTSNYYYLRSDDVVYVEPNRAKVATGTRFYHYLSSPVLVEAREPEKLSKVEKVPFAYDPGRNLVSVENKHYPLNQWARFPFGTIRFVRNPHQTGRAKKPLFFSLQNPAVVADDLLKNLGVNAASKLSTTISLTYQADVAEKGEAILNELLRQYLRSSVETENLLAANTLVFVEERLRDVERELDSIERRTQQFRSAQNVIDLSEQGRIFLESVADNDRRIVEINAQLAVLDQVARYVNGEGRDIGIVPTTMGIEDPVLAQLLQRLNTLELQRANLGATTGDNNPLVQSVDNEIRKIRPNIRSIVNNQQARLRASRNNLAGTAGQLNATLRTIPQKERQLLEISRQQAVKRDLYAFLLQRREEAALSSASGIAENRVVDWADASIGKKSSKKLLPLIGSLVLAFAAGVAFIFYKEDLSSKVLFRTEAESLLPFPVAGEIHYGADRTPIVVGNDVQTAAAEQFRYLQAALDLFNRSHRHRKILVTSGTSGEGKSFVSSNLAASLALAGKKVALLDLNLYHPGLSAVFKAGAKGGLSDFLAGRAELTGLVQPMSYKNLDLVPAGSGTAHSLGLLLGDRLADLLAYLEKHYDYTIIDTPPVERATDAYVLAQYADISLLVVRHGVTPKNLLRRITGTAKLEQVRNLHVIFKGVKGRGWIKKYYGYGFGYGIENKYAHPKRGGLG